MGVVERKDTLADRKKALREWGAEIQKKGNQYHLDRWKDVCLGCTTDEEIMDDSNFNEVYLSYVDLASHPEYHYWRIGLKWKN